jgi:hypothetical protein
MRDLIFGQLVPEYTDQDEPDVQAKPFEGQDVELAGGPRRGFGTHVISEPGVG